MRSSSLESLVIMTLITTFWVIQFFMLFLVKNDRPNQGYENSIVSGSIGTSFEQYRNVKVNLGLSASYDDLSTDGSASSSLKKQAGEFEEISANYGFTFDKRDRVFMPTSGSVISFRQNLPAYADKKFIETLLVQVNINPWVKILLVLLNFIFLL